jgi:hypothetical protein
MKQIQMSRLTLPVTIGLITLLTRDVAQSAIIPGSSVLQNGHAINAFADLDASNQLNAVGFQVSGAAIRDPGAAPTRLFMTLPSEGSESGFQVLEFGWNPQGHEPPGVYDVPHFDFHFYYISGSERMAIPGGQPVTVAPQFLASGYGAPGPTVPAMGGHSEDLTGPEFNGGTFTQTFVYGFFNGEEIFVEPMLTQDYLMGLSGSSTFGIRQPGQYALSPLPALVAGSVRHTYDSASDLYTISVGDFFDPAAVPEPGSLLLLAIGLPTVLVIGSRRTRRASKSITAGRDPGGAASTNC